MEGGEGVKKCLFFSTLMIKKLSMQGGGGGVKKYQNSVHVVVECPLAETPQSFEVFL